MRPILTPVILTLGLLGCGAAEMTFGGEGDEPFIDSDGDGLSDEEEIAMGLDPNSDDTDGDGYTDGTEDNSYTDPLDANDHPYAGGWPIDACRHDLEPTGTFNEGDIVKNYTILDQFDEQVRIHDFCDHVVLIEHAGFG